MDARLGILITENFDQANNAWDNHERRVNEHLGRIGKKHDETAKAGVRAYDQYRAGALASIKSIADYHVEWDAKTTKQLVSHIKELQDKRVDEQLFVAKAVAEGDRVQTRIHKNRLEQISLESRALKQLSIEREGVQKEGAGGVLGQLGVGRNITNLFGAVQSAFGQSPVGFGGPAMIEAASGGSRLVPVLTAIGPAALAATGGIAGFVITTKELISEGLKANQVLSAQRTAFEQAGIAPKAMNAEVKRSDELAAHLSDRWNISSDTVRKYTSTIAFLGKQHGQFASDAVTAAVAVEKFTKNLDGAEITGAQMLKVFEFADPEHAVNVGRLARVFPDLADGLKQCKSEGEALAFTMNYLQPTFKGLDREARSSDEALERASIAWGETKRAAGLAAVEALEPVLELITHLSTAINQNTGNIHDWMAGFIASLPIVGTFRTNVQQLNYIIERKSAVQATGEYLGLKNAWAAMPGPLSVLSSVLPEFSGKVETSGNIALDAGAKFRSATNDIDGFINHMSGMRGDTEKQIAGILIDQDRLKNGWRDATGTVHQLTAAEREQYSAAIETGKARLQNLAQYITTYDEGQKKLRIGAGLETAPKGSKAGGGSAHAFSTVVDEQARHLADLHELNLLSANDQIQLLDNLLATVKQMKVKDRDEQLRAEASLQQKLDALRKAGADKEKADNDASAKQTKEDFDAVTEAYNASIQKRLAALDENAARGKDIRRDQMLLEIENADSLLQVAIHQNNGVAAAEKHLNDLKSNLRLFDIKAEYEQGKRRIDLEEQVQTRLAQLIADPTKRETRLAELKHEHEARQLLEITDLTAQHDLQMASEAEFQAALEDIRRKSTEKAQKNVRDLVQIGMNPLNDAVRTNTDLWKKNGSIVGGILGDVAKKLLEISEEGLLDSVAKAIGGATKKQAEPSDSNPLGRILGMFHIPAFNDSKGPVGLANPPMINGKALVLADPQDWLIKVGNQIPGGNLSSGEGEEIAYTFAPGGENTKAGKQRAKNAVDAFGKQKAPDAARTARETDAADTALVNSQRAVPGALESMIKVHIDPIVAQIGDFFKSHNDEINQAATKYSSPLVRFGMGSSEVIGGGAMAATDAVFNTHSAESFKEEMVKLRQTFDGPGGDIGEFSGKTFGAFQAHSLFAGAGLGSVPGGVAAGVYRAAPEVKEQIGEGNYTHAAVTTGIEAFLGAAFANVPHFLEHSGVLSSTSAHLAIGASEQAVGLGVEDTGVPHVASEQLNTALNINSEHGKEKEMAQSEAIEGLHTLSAATSDASTAVGSQFVGAIGNVTGMLSGMLGKEAGGLGGLISTALPLLGMIPGFAGGTDYAPGGAAWVGERGPELMHVPRGSKITPNHRLGFGGGGDSSAIVAELKALRGAYSNRPAPAILDQDNNRISAARSLNRERQTAL